MTKQLNTDQLDRLAEIKEEILVLLSEALDLVRGTPEEQRANHWFATFCTALDKDNTQGSDSTITMQETIDALKESSRRPALVASASGRRALSISPGRRVVHCVNRHSLSGLRRYTSH